MSTRNEPERSPGLTLDDLLTLARRRGWIVPLIALLVTVPTYFLVKSQSKRYTATASLVFNQNSSSEQVAGIDVQSSDAEAQQETNVDLVTLGSTARQVGQALGLTPNEVRNAIAASAEALSNVVNVSAVAGSPEFAAKLANTYAKTFVRDQAKAAQKTLAAAQAVVQRQLSKLTRAERASGIGTALIARAQTLQELAQSESSAVQVAQSASVPGEPTSPKVKRTTLLALLIGLGLGVLVALLVDRLDRRVRDPEDLEAIYGLPVLCNVPESETFAAARSRGFQDAQTNADEEVFRLLRAHLLYFNVGRELQVVAIVSAAPGDGKSTVAKHLVQAAATVGSRALLLEADLRRPTLVGRLGISATQGLANCLVGQTTLEDAVTHVALPRGEGDHGELGFDVLPAGNPLPPNPAQLLESDAMKRLIDDARQRYDLIVIDTAPLSIVSDGFPLLGAADGVVVVGRVGSRTMDPARRLKKTLDATNAPLLGIVANGTKRVARGRYGYSYGYGYTNGESASQVVTDLEDPLRAADAVPAAVSAGSVADELPAAVSAGPVEDEPSEAENPGLVADEPSAAVNALAPNTDAQ